MITQFIDKDLVHMIPLRKLTIFYGSYMFKQLDLSSVDVKSYHFHMDREEILEKFKSVDNQEYILELTAAFIGAKHLKYDPATSLFSDSPKLNERNQVIGYHWLPFLNMSTGLCQMLGVVTILVNKKKFSGKNGILIHRPEASLHPTAQSHFGKFIAKSQLGIRKDKIGEEPTQLFIETYSEHILNGMRVGLLESDGNHEDVVINYMHTGTPVSIFLRKKVNSKATEFDRYPEGFMDQHSKDMMSLLDMK